MKEEQLTVTGMTCAACVRAVERGVQKLPASNRQMSTWRRKS